MLVDSVLTRITTALDVLERDVAVTPAEFAQRCNAATATRVARAPQDVAPVLPTLFGKDRANRTSQDTLDTFGDIPNRLAALMGHLERVRPLLEQAGIAIPPAVTALLPAPRAGGQLPMPNLSAAPTVDPEEALTHLEQALGPSPAKFAADNHLLLNVPVRRLMSALASFGALQDALLNRRLTPTQAGRFSMILRGIDARRDTITQAGLSLPAGVQAALQ